MSKCTECHYGCTYTETCDFYLLTGNRRGCPAGNDCTRFVPRGAARRVLPVTLRRSIDNKRTTDPRHATMLALYEQGLNDYRIAELTGISRDTVRRWRNREGLPPVPRKGGQSNDDAGA